MKTTFDGWIQNPMVKDNAVFTHRDMYKNMYNEKFQKIMLREAGDIRYTLYHNKKKDMYYIHAKIPSEVIEKFYYDVVVEFYTDDNTIRSGNSLSKYNVRFFSNDPAFVFTYLRVFKKNDMYLEQLSSKSPKLALTKDPTEKNPDEIISYVKSLYFAYLLMKQKQLFNKLTFNSYAQPYNESELIKRVRNSEDVINERQEKGKELEKSKRREKTGRLKTLDDARRERDEGKFAPNVKKTKVTKASSSTKKTKYVKKK